MASSGIVSVQKYGSSSRLALAWSRRKPPYFYSSRLQRTERSGRPGYECVVPVALGVIGTAAPAAAPDATGVEAVAAPFTLAFAFGPIVLRATRVAFAFAARAAFSSSVSGAGTFLGARPKVVRTAGWLAYMMSAICRTAAMIGRVEASVASQSLTAFERADFAVVVAFLAVTRLWIAASICGELSVTPATVTVTLAGVKYCVTPAASLVSSAMAVARFVVVPMRTFVSLEGQVSAELRRAAFDPPFGGAPASVV